MSGTFVGMVCSGKGYKLYKENDGSLEYSGPIVSN